MSFNNGKERRKLNAKWEHLRVQYREAGMSEDAIQAMYEFDLGVLNQAPCQGGGRRCHLQSLSRSHQPGGIEPQL